MIFWWLDSGNRKLHDDRATNRKNMINIKAMARVAVAVAACLGVSQAGATTTFQIGNGGLETFNLTWDGHSENGALAGGISLTRIGSGIPSFNSVCTDIGGTLYLESQYVYSDATVFQNQDGIRPSWGAGNSGIALDASWASLTPAQQNNASAAVQAAADIFYHHQGVLNGGSLSDKAALQLAVWEALYDTTKGSASYNLTDANSRFSVSSGDADAISTAGTWLSQVNVNANYTGYLLIPTPESQHGLNGQEVFYNVTPVPEPATILAAAFLLLPFGVSTFRVLRRNRAA